jgi:AraC-like DNA-binding protein
MNDILGLLIFFGSGLSLLMAAAGVVGRGRKPALECALYALIGCLLLEFFLTHSLGLVADMATRPLQTEVFLLIRCAKYSLGPLFYVFFTRLTTYRPLHSERLLLHFAPQVAAWALSLVYMASSLGGWTSFTSLRTAMGLVTDASLAHLLTYVAVALVAARTAGNRTQIAVAASSAAVSAGAAVLLVLYSVTGWRVLEMGSQGLLAAGMVVLFLVTQAWPDCLRSFGQESRRKTYQRSLLSGADTELLTLRLADLMEGEKIYCDEHLTLETLAERLSISRNRLSELLNGVLQTNFAGYVNRYRVEEVKRLLGEHPTRSILSHAFAAGFNSKSVFNEAFKRFTGMTPQDYRERTRAVGGPRSEQTLPTGP